MKTKLCALTLAIGLLTMTGMNGQCQQCGPTAPDPSAVRIEFALVSQDTATTGTVQIVGVVENIGGGMFQSGENQQALVLYEYQAGASTGTEVARQSFQDLAVGDTQTVSYTRAWDKSVEFPPSYRLIISYDPDIYLDGNPNNDDCNGLNNTITRSGTEMNSVFP